MERRFAVLAERATPKIYKLPLNQAWPVLRGGAGARPERML